MPTVKFTSALKRFYPDLQEVEVTGSNISEVIKEVDIIYPNLSTYLLSEDGALRKHVNIFIGSKIINDKEKLQDTVEEGDEVYIMQALSGG